MTEVIAPAPDTTAATYASKPTASPGTFSQADVDRIVADRLAREQKKHKDYADLKETAKEVSDLRAQLADAELLRKELEAEKVTALKFRVAAAKGITKPDAIDRLRGKTQKELEADADLMLELIKPPAPPHDGGPRPTAPATTDMNALLRQAAGR